MMDFYTVAVCVDHEWRMHDGLSTDARWYPKFFPLFLRRWNDRELKIIVQIAMLATARLKARSGHSAPVKVVPIPWAGPVDDMLDPESAGRT